MAGYYSLRIDLGMFFCLGLFILPYIVYSQISEDCTFCLIMLETGGILRSYSLWERELIAKIMWSLECVR